MAKKTSAGLLMYRFNNKELEVFLVHPGGPFFKNKDNDYWSIPKGEIEENEDLFKTAKREFEEETGIKPGGDFVELGEIKQKSGKTVYAWAFEKKDKTPIELKSNYFEIEWPPRTGKKQKFPEIDRAEFFNTKTAEQKIVSGQFEFIKKLFKHLNI